MSRFQDKMTSQPIRGSYATASELDQEAAYLTAVQHGDVPEDERRWTTQVNQARTALGSSVPENHIHAYRLFHKIAGLGISSVPVDPQDPTSAPLVRVAKDAIDWMEALHGLDKPHRSFAPGFRHTHNEEEHTAREVLRQTMIELSVPKSGREAVAAATIESAHELQAHRFAEAGYGR